MSVIYDCIVIGAGYAGLSAAKSLKDAGKSVLVLEARNRVGGRVKTENYEDGTYLDMGGAFLAQDQRIMYGFAKEFGVETYDIHSTGRVVSHYAGKHTSYVGLYPSIPIWDLLDLGLFVYRFEKLSDTVNLEQPWKTSDAKRLDNMTFKEYIDKHCWFKTARDAVTMAAELIWGAGTSEISALHALFYSKAAVSFTMLCTNKDGAQNQLIKGGAQTIANKIRDYLGDAVHLEEPVQRVQQPSGADNTVLVTTPKGTYTSRYMICATPPQQVLRVTFDPTIPHQRRSLLQRSPAGSYWKYHACYDKPFWRETEFSGEATSPDFILSMVMDTTPENVSHGTLMSFVVGHKARLFSTKSEEERKDEVLESLVAFYGEEARKPYRFVEHTMMDEEYIGGCPVSSPAPGLWTTLGPWLKKPFGKVHWAGTETSSRWNGYMEGAANSGQCAAREILELLDSQKEDK